MIEEQSREKDIIVEMTEADQTEIEEEADRPETVEIEDVADLLDDLDPDHAKEVEGVASKEDLIEETINLIKMIRNSIS